MFIPVSNIVTYILGKALRDKLNNYFFIFLVKSGKNTIERSSKDFWWTSDSWTPSKQDFKDVLEGLAGTTKYHYDETNPEYQYPQRLILPKGRRGGMPFYLYVIITPHLPPASPKNLDHVTMGKVGTGTRRLDSRPLGYPFDRYIEHEHDYMSLSNMHFEDVLIFHKKESDINQV